MNPPQNSLYMSSLDQSLSAQPPTGHLPDTTVHLRFHESFGTISDKSCTLLAANPSQHHHHWLFLFHFRIMPRRSSQRFPTSNAHGVRALYIAVHYTSLALNKELRPTIVVLTQQPTRKPAINVHWFSVSQVHTAQLQRKQRNLT